MAAKIQTAGGCEKGPVTDERKGGREEGKEAIKRQGEREGETTDRGGNKLGQNFIPAADANDAHPTPWRLLQTATKSPPTQASETSRPHQQQQQGQVQLLALLLLLKGAANAAKTQNPTAETAALHRTAEATAAHTPQVLNPRP